MLYNIKSDIQTTGKITEVNKNPAIKLVISEKSATFSI